jgi:hypothetical protein
MMARPNHIRLLSDRIPIRWSAADIAAASRREGEPLYGMYHDGEIIVDPGIRQTQDTLLHETLHAIIAKTGLREAGGPLHGDAEEQVVQALTPMLLHMLRDNPGLVGFLVER